MAAVSCLGLGALGALTLRSGASTSPVVSNLRNIVLTRASETVSLDFDACWNYDDDATAAVSAATCGPSDKAAYCGSESAQFRALCPDACSGDETYALLCSWEAVSRLAESCSGTFVPKASLPGRDAEEPRAIGGRSGDGNAATNEAAAVAPAPLGSDYRLDGCDEAAFCRGSLYGNRSVAAAVAAFYGGPGMPLRSNGTVSGRWGEGRYRYVSAAAALNAIDNDWAYWCSASVLDQLARGNFTETSSYAEKILGKGSVIGKYTDDGAGSSDDDVVF